MLLFEEADLGFARVDDWLEIDAREDVACSRPIGPIDQSGRAGRLGCLDDVDVKVRLDEADEIEDYERRIVGLHTRPDRFQVNTY